MSVLLVGYNSAAALTVYLPDFVRLLPEEYEIVLIDNDSSDDTVATFERICPRGRVIATKSNLGFAKAVNIGAAEALGEWLLLLNPDAAVNVADIEALRQSALERSNCGAVGPVVESGGKCIPAGRFPTVWRMCLHSTGLSVMARYLSELEGHYIRNNGIGRGLRKVDWITGGCMLVRHEAWLAVGGLSERWFMYAEDIELCFRFKRSGYEVWLNQDVTVFHEIGQSSAGVDGKTSTVWLANLFDFYSTAIATNAAGKLLWKSVMWAGYAFRSLLFCVSAHLLKKNVHKGESTRFRIFATSIRPTLADFKVVGRGAASHGTTKWAVTKGNGRRDSET